MQPDVDAVVELGFGVDMRRTLAPLRRGPGDPTMRVTDAATWRTSRMPTGTVTYALTQVDPRRVRVRAWGPGAEELLAGVPDLLGADYNHLSVAGHAVLAETVWQALPRQVTDPS